MTLNPRGPICNRAVAAAPRILSCSGGRCGRFPRRGRWSFICQWQVYGIGETRVGIDGQVIPDAARRSVQLWSEDG